MIKTTFILFLLLPLFIFATQVNHSDYERFIQEVKPNKQTTRIILNDGSAWDVKESNSRAIARSWQGGDSIYLHPNTDYAPILWLENTTINDHAIVNFASLPHVPKYALSVKSYSGGIITLSDGSKWAVGGLKTMVWYLAGVDTNSFKGVIVSVYIYFSDLWREPSKNDYIIVFFYKNGWANYVDVTPAQ